MADRLRDPRGWFLDSLPWRLRRLAFAWQLRQKPSSIPDEAALIGLRRPPEHVFEYFRKLDAEIEAPDRASSSREEDGSEGNEERNGGLDV